MIKLLRVDHRLLHGQVAFSWTQGLGADCILIANDDVPKNEMCIRDSYNHLFKNNKTLTKQHYIKI